MKALVFGAGNLLLSDEGFGVHAIRYLQGHYAVPENVELYDGGTKGIMASHVFEEAEHIVLIDVVAVEGAPGTILRYTKEEILLNRLPTKLSPHQIGIQEMLTLCEMRGNSPESVTLFGIIPDSYEAGTELTPPLAAKLPEVAHRVIEVLKEKGFGPFDE